MGAALAGLLAQTGCEKPTTTVPDVGVDEPAPPPAKMDTGAESQGGDSTDGETADGETQREPPIERDPREDELNPIAPLYAAPGPRLRARFGSLSRRG